MDCPIRTPTFILGLHAQHIWTFSGNLLNILYFLILGAYVSIFLTLQLGNAQYVLQNEPPVIVRYFSKDVGMFVGKRDGMGTSIDHSLLFCF